MLKARLWTDPDGEAYEDLPYPKAKDFDKAKANNILRRIDTSAMIVDCMTKRMKPDVLPVMDGHLDLTPTAESLLIKSKKKAGRAKAKSESLGKFQNDAIHATDTTADFAEATDTFTDEANFVQGVVRHASASSHDAPTDISDASPGRICREKRAQRIRRVDTVFGKDR